MLIICDSSMTYVVYVVNFCNELENRLDNLFKL